MLRAHFAQVDDQRIANEAVLALMGIAAE